MSFEKFKAMTIQAIDGSPEVRAAFRKTQGGLM